MSLFLSSAQFAVCTVGWSEKHKNWKMQKYRADSEPRHSTDFRPIFVIMIGCFVSCEIGQTYFTESRGSFGTLQHPDFKSLSSNLGLNPHFSDPGHTSDFRTIFEIMIRPFVSCEIRKIYFTESDSFFIYPWRFLESLVHLGHPF